MESGKAFPRRKIIASSFSRKNPNQKSSLDESELHSYRFMLKTEPKKLPLSLKQNLLENDPNRKKVPLRPFLRQLLSFRLIKSQNFEVKSCKKCTNIFIYSLLIIMCVETFLLLSKQNPLEVNGSLVREYNSIHELKSKTEQLNPAADRDISQSTNIQLRTFDDEWDENMPLSKTWDFVVNGNDISMDQVDSNTCIRSHLGNVNCFPSIIIIGFEKCSSTTMNSWLGSHPNILHQWTEKRFFDHIKSKERLQTNFIDYLRSLPRIPGGKAGVGKYWVLEKSPAYATAVQSAEFVKELLPSARIIAVTRNPTARAYSMFLMYTCHYNLERSIHEGSYFVKNMVTGDVEYTPLFGAGKEIMPDEISPTDDEWRYLSYPPDPKDFDSWIRNEIKRHNGIDYDDDNSRVSRLLLGGLYSHFLKIWAKHFPSNQLIVIPKEIFFTKDAPLSMEKLQKVLGLPNFDYSTILEENEKGFFDVKSPDERINSWINSYTSKAAPMLKSTKDLLDQFYCEQNMELSKMLGGLELPGYSCAEDGVS